MLVAGLDEAGRGSFIGRVYSACVILPEDFSEKVLKNKITIRDSKKMSAKKRVQAREFIEKNALAFSVQWAEKEEIEQTNILRATMLSMHRCIDSLTTKPEKILVDGNYFIPYPSIPHECIEKGDDSMECIAAASILAKTYRDEYIAQLCTENPILEEYAIHKNMGYGTKVHLEKIREKGSTLFHRRTFGICKRILNDPKNDSKNSISEN